MLVMRDTSHFDIFPCGRLEQSPSGKYRMHAKIAAWSSALDSGEYSRNGRMDNAVKRGQREVKVDLDV